MRPSHIRVRLTMASVWVWELVTADGHVANASEPFEIRGDCEADAQRQGLRVSGMARRLKLAG